MMLLQKPLRQTSRRAAFTLMEMLVVVAIIVVLAGLGGYYLLGQLNQSRDSAAKAQMQVLTKAVKTYMIDHNGMPPPSLQQLLVGPDELGKGPYLESADALKTPFGTDYVYDPSGANNRGLCPDISCQTPQGKTIGNWSTH